MSAFEAGCWNWYSQNVNPFSMEAGIVGDLFVRLRLDGCRALFLSAMNKIHNAFAIVQHERMEHAARERANG